MPDYSELPSECESELRSLWRRCVRLSGAEIAEVMGCTVSAVESLLFRANAALKDALT